MNYIFAHLSCLLVRRSVAFTGSAREAVQYALHYLGPLVHNHDGVMEDSSALSPCLTLPSVFDLLYHANQVSSLFALEAVVGNVCSK